MLTDEPTALGRPQVSGAAAVGGRHLAVPLVFAEDKFEMVSRQRKGANLDVRRADGGSFIWYSFLDELLLDSCFVYSLC